MPTVDLTPDIVNRIVEIGKLRYPNEACGVLLPSPKTAHGTRQSQVVELPNRCLTPANQYIIMGADLMLELQEWFLANPGSERKIAFWHTHPGGNIGPSRGDLQTRMAGIAYLVVALTESGPIPTWF